MICNCSEIYPVSLVVDWVLSPVPVNQTKNGHCTVLNVQLDAVIFRIAGLSISIFSVEVLKPNVLPPGEEGRWIPGGIWSDYSVSETMSH